MATVAITVLATGSIFFVLGIPFAFAIRRRDEGWIPIAIDAAVLGTVFLTLAVTLWSWLGVAGIVVSALLLAAAVGWVVLRRPGVPRRPARVPVTLLAGWLVVAVVAVAFRLQDSTFLPWVGDMGAYVNWANEFVRLGELKASWPPIFPSYLAISTFLFGTGATTSGVAWCGYLLIAIVARLLGQLGANRWVILAVGGALALNVHAIWYSSFPGSESLNAPVFLAWISAIVTLLRTPRGEAAPVLAIVGLLMLHLGLLRGSGSFLLAPLVAVAVVALLIPAWRGWGPRLWQGLLVSVIGAEISIWYGITVIPRYVVDTQLRMLVPGRLYDVAESVGLLSPTPVFVAALVVLAALVAVGVALAGRYASRTAERGTTAAARLAWVAAGALALGVAAEGIVGANVWFILARTGLWVVVGAVVALAYVARKRMTTDVVPVVALLAVTALVLIAFHTNRLGNNRTHNFFLYWDRYLVSEVIPALVVLAGVGASWLAVSLVNRWAGRPSGARGRALTAGAVALAVVLTALPSIPTLVRETQHGYLAGSYPFEQKLMSFARPGDALMWSATAHGYAPGFFFPNTWMAFAIPMKRSFGYDFLNVDQGEYNFGPDDILDTSQLLDALEDHPEVTVYETQMSTGIPLGERISDPRIHIEKAGEAVSEIYWIKQAPELQDWTTARIPVVVWTVTRG